MLLVPIISTSVQATVGATAVSAASAMADQLTHLFAASTNCWIRQGTAKLVTCVAKASMVDTDFMTITTPFSTAVYEFDVVGNGVTAGRVQVNISADTTAANVAARLRTAILATQTELRVVDPADGTLQVDLADNRNLTITENVANAGFTIGAGVMQVSAASGSEYVPAGTSIALDGRRGAQLGVIQDSVGGKSTVTQCQVR
jgi:hypothetical protein